MSNLDLGEMINENERLNTKGGQTDYLANFVEMPEGNGHVTIRLLPPAKPGMFGREKNRFYVVTRVHKVNGKSLHCPKELVDKKWVGDCPICRYYNWLWSESEKKSKDEAEKMQAQARAIKPIERYYYNALVRSQLNKETGQLETNIGPKILSVGKTIHSMIVRAIVGDEKMDEKPLGDVTDVKVGRDFKIMKTIRKSGNESYPNYSDSKFVDPSPLGNPEEIANWLNSLHDLHALRVLKDRDYLVHELKVHNGVAKEASDDGFDPSEFQKPTVDERPIVEEAPASSPAQATSKTETAPSRSDSVLEEDKSLADDDFMKELREMGQSQS